MSHNAFQLFELFAFDDTKEIFHSSGLAREMNPTRKISLIFLILAFFSFENCQGEESKVKIIWTNNDKIPLPEDKVHNTSFR